MQNKQLKTLNDITGVDFTFVPADKNRFHVKYYEHKCATDAEFHRVAGELNQDDNIFYTSLDNPDNTISIIVVENRFDATRIENISSGRISDLSIVNPIGKLHGNDVFLDIIPTQDGGFSNIVGGAGRAKVVVNINGHRLPFYISSGLSGKDKEYGIASGKWYPIQGISAGGWLNKMPDMLANPYPELDAICKMLEEKFPAAEYRQAAMQNKLPIANRLELLARANASFPEGMPATEQISYAYYKNHLVYLPAVINAWRSRPTQMLNISDGLLRVPELHALSRLRKTDIIASSELDDDMIWFSPVPKTLKGQTSGTTEQDIERQLAAHGIETHIIVTSDNKSGFGIPADTLVRHFAPSKTQGFAAGMEKIDKIPLPQVQKADDGILRTAYSRFKDLLNR